MFLNLIRKENLLKLNSQLLSISPLLIDQQRTHRKFKPPAKKRKKISLIKFSTLQGPINKRYSRTNLGRVLINRIYFRFEIYKLENHLPYLTINNFIVKRIWEKAFRKLHNYVVLDEEFVDKLIELYSNREYKDITLRQRIKAEQCESKYLSEVTGKPISEFLKNGIHYDEYGCPKYGEFCNTMFVNYKKINLFKYNASRLIDAKINTPKFCFDFYPCNISDLEQRKMIFDHLNLVLQSNLESLTPLNIYFTNYKKDYDRQFIEIMTDAKDAIPNLIDIRINHMGSDLNSKDKKLIIIMKDGNKQIYYDYNANYMLPVFTNSDFINNQAHAYYHNQFDCKQNVEYVYVPAFDYIDNESILNFSFYYYVISSLRNGLDVKDSILNAFYNYNKNNRDFYVLRGEKNKILDKKKPIYKKSYQLKKYAFKHFDDLEDELN